MTGLTRRDAFAAAGAGSLGLLSFSGGAAAAALTPTETANIEIIAAFLKAWGDPAADGAKVAAPVADDCVIRMDETKPPLMGKAAGIAAIDGYFARGLRFDIKVHQTFAKGPVVASWRTDVVIDHGKPGATFDAVGVYVLKDGKIHEWSDYMLTKPT